MADLDKDVEEVPSGPLGALYYSPPPPPPRPPLNIPTFEYDKDLFRALRYAEEEGKPEPIELDDSGHKEQLLNTAAEILSSNPFYQKGLVDPVEFFTLKSPYMADVFPESVGDSPSALFWKQSWIRKDTDEKRDELLQRLTNLSPVTYGDMAKSAFRGVLKGVPAAEAALYGGRLAFMAAPVYMPGPWTASPKTAPVGFLSKPVAGVAGGLSAAIGTSYIIDPVVSDFIKDRENLLPGGEGTLAGAETTGLMISGLPSIFRYSPKAVGPARVAALLNESSGEAAFLTKVTQATAVGRTPPRALRLSAFLDELLPGTRRAAQRRPGVTAAGEGSAAVLSGYLVDQLDAKDDPVLRTFIELGSPLAPNYTLARVLLGTPQGIKKGAEYLPSAVGYRFIKDSGGLRPAYRRIVSGVKVDPSAQKQDILETSAGRIAVQEILKLVEDMGEDPIAVATRMAQGEDWLEGLSDDALRVLNVRANQLAGNEEAENLVSALPAGVRAKSPAIIALQGYFANAAQKQKLGREAKTSSAKAADFQRGLIELFHSSGDQNLMKLALELQQDRYANAFVDRFADVVDYAVRASQRVGGTEFGALRRAGFSEEEIKGIDSAEAIANAMDQQLTIASKMANRLYEDAKGDVPSIRVFKNAAGEEIDEPSFVTLFDEITDKLNPETAERIFRNAELQEVLKTIDRYRGILSLPGALPTTGAREKFSTKLSSYEDGSQVKRTFEQILSGDVDLGAGSIPGSKFNQLFAETSPGVRKQIDRALKQKIENASVEEFDFENLAPTAENIALLDDLITRTTAGSKYKSTDQKKAATEGARLLNLKRTELLRLQDSGPVSFERNVAGQLTPTEENVRALQRVEDLLSNQSSTPELRDILGLVKLQKTALRSELDADFPDAIDYSDLDNLRKTLGGIKEKSRGKVFDQELYGIAAQLEKALLDDLDNTIDPSVSEKYNIARTFYRGMNDALTRSFVGLPTARAAFDQVKVSPEEFVRKLLRGKDEEVASRYSDIWDSFNYLNSRAKQDFPEDAVLDMPDGPVPLSDLLKDNTESISGWATHILAKDIIFPLEQARNKAFAAGASKPEQDRLMLRALQGVKERLGSEGIERLKNLLGDDFGAALEGATDAVDFANRSKTLLDSLREKAKDNYALSEVVKSRAPSQVIENAINGPNPVQSLNQIFDEIRKVGRMAEAGRVNADGKRLVPENWNEEDAVKGLKSLIFERVFLDSGGRGGLDPAKAFERLFVPGKSLRKDTRNSLADWMISKGLTNQKELDGYQKILNNLARFEAAVQLGEIGPEQLGDINFIADAFTRLSGAALGRQAGNVMPFGGPNSLVASQIGVRATKTFVETIPQLRRLDAMGIIVNDDELLALALRTPRNGSEKKAISNIITRALKSKLGEDYGMGAVVDDQLKNISGPPRRVPLLEKDRFLEDEESSEEETPDKQSSVRPPAVPTRTVAAAQQPPIPPRPAPTPAPQSVASAPTQAPASPETRQRYAALFPNDPASSMIRSQQGIGGLLG